MSGPTSRIIVRARGGWGRRLAHRRRSPSHPPHAPTTGPISRIIVRARGGWGRRLAHRRRSPSHPPHAPTTDNITHHRTGTRGMGATSRPLSQISVPSPSCPDNRPNITHHRTGTRGMGATSRPSSQISVPSPSCPDNRQYHASSYGHEGDGGDVSPIVADLRPIPLMPRQPTISRIIVRARGGWGRRLAHRRRSPSHPPHAPTTGPISRIIVRARGGWGRRLAHRRRSPSHPPHAPTTGLPGLCLLVHFIECEIEVEVQDQQIIGRADVNHFDPTQARNRSQQLVDLLLPLRLHFLQLRPQEAGR